MLVAPFAAVLQLSTPAFAMRKPLEQELVVHATGMICAP